MPTIHHTTFIQAPTARVFDLSRSIALYKKLLLTNEETVTGGGTSDLMKLHDTITWRASHLGRMRTLTSKMIAISFPDSFTYEMQSGDFQSMHHEHHFKEVQNGTLMIDLFHFESPYGFLGNMLNQIYLTSYLKKLLFRRNATIKAYAESN